MTAHQISFQSQQSSTGAIKTAVTSLNAVDARAWQYRLTPFLQAGRPVGRAFLDFGVGCAAVRWSGGPAQPLTWQYAHAYVAERGQLTAAQALELPPLDPEALTGGGSVPVVVLAHGPGYQSIAELARSVDATQVLTPLLAHMLSHDPRVVNMPWRVPLVPEAALWALVRVLDIIKEPQRLSFLSCASRSLAPDTLAGPFISFQEGAPERQPEPGFLRLASFLAGRFADSPGDLRQEVAEQGIDMTADRAGSISRLLALLPTAQPKKPGEWWLQKPAQAPALAAEVSEPPHPTANPPATLLAPASAPPAPPQPSAPAASAPPRPAAPSQPTAPPATAPPQPAARPQPAVPPTSPPRAAGDVVVCPICLGDITDWNTQSPWEWDPAGGIYQELKIPPGLTELQRAPYLRNAYVRCTAGRTSAGQSDDQPHFLPANYGRFGRPVVLGFVGMSMAGKTHLLSAMVAGIVGGELRKGYQVSHDPLDHARHQTFLDSHVNPLLRKGKVLKGTEEDVLEFADAFLMNDESGQRRPVAFFDIAGGDLASLQKKKATDFLYMADGLFFVVDPERLTDRWVEDNTFSNVLNIIRGRPRQEPVSAAIVLTKADTLRFEEPIDRWLRYEPELEPLNATQLLRESADVYGYLESRNALALATPYDKCAKATLHVASATGGSGAEQNTVYARGVRPRRVMRPLAAMLAMTGVLTGPDAEKVGI